jgi:hypothetical protein
MSVQKGHCTTIRNQSMPVHTSTHTHAQIITEQYSIPPYSRFWDAMYKPPIARSAQCCHTNRGTCLTLALPQL